MLSKLLRCYHIVLIPQKLHAVIVCAWCLNRLHFFHFIRVRMVSITAHLWIETPAHVFVYAWEHKCTRWAKPEHYGFTTHAHFFPWGVHAHSHLGAWLHTGECSVYGTWWIWAGSVQKVKRVWWLRHPEHMPLIPFTLLVKQNRHKRCIHCEFWEQSTVPITIRVTVTVMHFSWSYVS